MTRSYEKCYGKARQENKERRKGKEKGGKDLKITVLVENQPKEGYRGAHGLAFYIETKKHRLLFDVGPDETLFENAEKKGISLKETDTVIISHGHRDHGGALRAFLEKNQKAVVYIQKSAFEPHYSCSLSGKREIGLDQDLQNHRQVILLEGDFRIDEELQLFTIKDRSRFYSEANEVLYGEKGKDDFAHEQNLMIFEEKPVLLMGCGHTGVVNILERAKEYKPEICIGGFHLCIPATGRMIPKTVLDGIAKELSQKELSYYTCHCTGQEAFAYLSEKMKLKYLHGGEELNIGGGDYEV